MAVGVRAAVVAAVASILFVPSCGKRAPTGAGEEKQAARLAVTGEKTEDEVSAPRPPEEAADLALAKAIDRKICRKRGCCVSGIEDAGTDRKGRSMVVATIDAGEGGVASCLVPPEAEPETFGSEVLDNEPSPLHGQAAAAPDEPTSEDEKEDPEEEGGGGSGDADDRNDCHPYEYYLVVHTKAKIRSRALLSHACNNGYGAAGVGEDDVSTDKETRTFTHDQEGGSAWRWRNRVTVGLDPLRIVSIGDSSFWTIDEDATSRSADWNHDTFDGNESWSIPDCEGRRKQEEALKRDAAAPRDQFPSSKSFNALIVPRVQLPPAFVADGWRSVGIGDCGAFVDGDKHGFAVYGGKGSAADASMRAVVSQEAVLFVEITDDRWTSSGKTWVKEDHLELWLAPAGSTSTEMLCDGPLPPDPSKQWGIRISDGQVFAGFGSPESLAGVDVVRAGRTARVRIPLGDRLKDDDGAALTVVYSDSDDGVHQKRLIATSTVERGQELSLGHVRDVDPAHATCVIKGKALRINRPPLAVKPGEAIAQ